MSSAIKALSLGAKAGRTASKVAKVAKAAKIGSKAAKIGSKAAKVAKASGLSASDVANIGLAGVSAFGGGGGAPPQPPQAPSYPPQAPSYPPQAPQLPKPNVVIKEKGSGKGWIFLIGFLIFLIVGGLFAIGLVVAAVVIGRMLLKKASSTASAAANPFYWLSNLPLIGGFFESSNDEDGSFSSGPSLSS